MFPESWDWGLFMDYLAAFYAEPIVGGAFFIVVGLAIVGRVVGLFKAVAK